MYEKPQFEIPETVRELAERTSNRRAAPTPVHGHGAPGAEHGVEVSGRDDAERPRDPVPRHALRRAEHRRELRVRLDLARARDLREYLEVQQRWAQQQMQNYAQQAQDLGRMMAEAAQKSQPKT